jgi:hypothetical protein
VTDKPDKPDKGARLLELLGTTSNNFLGSGLTASEFMQLYRAEQIAASWVLQPTEEKKRRRRAVIQLSQELGRIQQATEFSTRLCELAIESVIEGDRKMVEEWAEHFTFNEEGGESDQHGVRARYAPVFATFRELLLQTLRTDKEPPA